MNALKELVKDALTAATQAREMCEDTMIDVRLISDEDYELLVAEDPDFHADLCKLEDIAVALAEILG